MGALDMTRACEVHWESIVIAIYWDFTILEQEIEKKNSKIAFYWDFRI